MESKSLAVRYRPTKLDEVFGQDNAVAVVEGMFAEKKFPSAILISGHTGCGKTTIAQIFGRRINCAKGTICGKCMSCTFGEKHPDIIFHNAGTDGKIEDIRKLVQSAKVSPTTRKRIIIVDEAHKLTGASLDALLLPTETTPKNTIWIFCTTNTEKLTNTLVNRCVRLNLKAIPHDPMVARLKDIVKAEGIKKLSGKKGSAVLDRIAEVSNGSMRDAISHLESLSLAIAGGRKFDIEGSLVNFVTDTGFDLDQAAADVVGSILSTDLVTAISAVRNANNARGIVNKARWLTDYLIGVKTKTTKFTPYSGRVFKDKYPKTKTPLAFLIMIQSMLVEAEIRMNSCSIDENVLLSTAIGNLIIEAKG